jgi:hypothetical protein
MWHLTHRQYAPHLLATLSTARVCRRAMYLIYDTRYSTVDPVPDTYYERNCSSD